jgi:hypothetical protein
MMPNGWWKPSPPTAPNTSTWPDQRMLDCLVVPKVDALEQITLRTVGGVLGGQVTASIVIRSRRVLGYPGPGGYTVSLVMLVAVSVAAVVWPPPFR